MPDPTIEIAEEAKDAPVGVFEAIDKLQPTRIVSIDAPTTPQGTTVADEIKNNNVAQVWFDEKTQLWTARLGPEGRGITAQGLRPLDAFAALQLQAHYGGWIFDPSWKPVD